MTCYFESKEENKFDRNNGSRGCGVEQLWTFKQAETCDFIYSSDIFLTLNNSSTLILNFVVCVLSSRHVVVMTCVIYFRKTYNDKQQKICNNVLIQCKNKPFV